MAQDTDYFRRRSMQEREAATHAADPLARDLHVQMAERYDALVENTSGGGRSRQRSSLVGA
jgi:hypothetical protein